jgi:hypothetical protein
MTIKPELQQEYDKYVEINSEDEYSKACITAGEAFGNALDEGKTFEEANAAMCEAEDGLTGFMASMAVKAVAHFHPRGEEVRVWWNERNGVKSDKGIVNTAVMTFEDDGTVTPEIETV